MMREPAATTCASCPHAPHPGGFCGKGPCLCGPRVPLPPKLSLAQIAAVEPLNIPEVNDAT